MIKLAATLLMLAVLILGIIKKYNTPMLFWGISTIALLILQPVTGTSILGANSTGVYLFDIFEYFITRAYSALTSNVGIIIFMFGYVGYMNEIQASDLFAKTILKPLKKVKKPIIVGCLAILVGVLLKLVIPYSVALGALLVATLSPVLLALGLSVPTVACITLLPLIYCWGPSNSLSYMAFDILGITNYTVPEMFIQYEFLPTIIGCIVMILVFVPTSKYFDKKEKPEDQEAPMAILDDKMPDVPKYFIFLPILPLMLILIFSQLVTGIVIGVPAAFLLCFLFAVLVVSFSKKSLKGGINSAVAFFKGAGGVLASSGFNSIGATTFAGVVSAIGGLSVIAQALQGFSGTAMFIATVLISAVAIFAIPNASGVIAVVTPIIGAYIAATGVEPYPYIVAIMVGIAYGYAVSPATVGMQFVAPTFNVSPMTLVKRNVVPSIAGLIATVIVMVLMFNL